MRLLIIVLVFAVSASFSQQISEYIQSVWYNFTAPHHEKCVAESKVDPKLARTWLGELNMPDEEPFRCFIKCMYQSLAFMRYDGTFDQHEIVDVAHYMNHDMTEFCTQESDDEPNLCKKSYKFGWCAVHKLTE